MRFTRLVLLVSAVLALAGGTMLVAHAGNGTTAAATIHACARMPQGELRTIGAEQRVGDQMGVDLHALVVRQLAGNHHLRAARAR